MLEVDYIAPQPRSVVVREGETILASAIFNEALLDVGHWTFRIEGTARFVFIVSESELGPTLPDERIAGLLQALVLGYRQLEQQSL